ncbi:flagellar type III secretion system pore protein FliP [Clostridium tagluense]|nr:flagellar type III secretion system pore protein FliP [Clostridium tagluense]MBU3126634.1 flagellar type III secretion system pore protein FliP [Clostridium tagluense]MCB2310002.1 flagellar type III secretion system pore protein FliP [Clostridium tagluense]MCB2314468.1 flagellar type III secretion system pore protein FliP [Clostridium tagluense]MCB2319316.1 flagellar type III secretion system pore protein FliP [Clostridium tagluense]MCB2324596.1 flagellar type III secretion system pore prot
MKIKNKNIVIFALIMVIVGIVTIKVVNAAPQTLPIPKINLSIDKATTPTDYVDNIKLLVVLTVLTLLPSFIIMTTSFVRIIIVLSLFKSAIGVQQAIPKEVIIGLALFLTFFTMAPTFTKVNKDALTPYLNNKITQSVAIDKGSKPMRDFMLKQTRAKDLKLFLEVGKLEDTVKNEVDAKGKVVMSKGKPKLTYDKVPLYAVVPSFIISELRRAFEMGFLLFIPFIIIDIVTGSVLMAMGMMMLPPVMISLPFKLLLFIMVDGWNLLVKSLIMSFS